MSQPTSSPLECLALATLVRMSGLSTGLLADDLGISKSRMSKHLNSLVPPQDRRDRIVEMTGFSLADYEEVLSNLSRTAARRERTLGPATPVDPAPQDWSEIDARAAIAGREAQQRFLERQAEMVRARKTAEARAEAETLCVLLENDPKPWLAVEKVRRLQTWAVAERLAHRSAESAPECPVRALELAALACRAAELAPCAGPFRERLLGYTLTFAENAARAAGDLARAEALFIRACEHWKAGAAAPGPLEEWRLQSLAGSFHRDRQRFAESLAELDASLENAPAEARGRILAARALTVEQMGDPEQALELWIEAEQNVDRQQNPSLLFIVLFNRAALLCRLNRFADAGLLLKQIAALPETVRSGMQRIRLRWLRGSVAAGFGRWEEAERDLQAVRQELAGRDAVLEHALVSLELVVLLSRRERSREIRKLAPAIAGLARNEKLSPAARAALRMICEADEGPGVTPALAEQALHLLMRAPKAGASSPDPSSAEEGRGEGPSALLAGRGNHGAVATTAGIEDAAAVPGLGARRGLPSQETGGRGPEGGQPGNQLVHSAGRLQGGGGASRPGRRGHGEDHDDDETGGETPPDGNATRHESPLLPGTAPARPPLAAPAVPPKNTGAGSRIEMSREIHPEDFSAFVRVLLALWDGSQKELAAKAGLSPSTIANYLNGSTRPRRNIVVRLAWAAQVDLWVVDLYLLPAIAIWRKSKSRTQAGVMTDILQKLTAELQGLGHKLLPPAAKGPAGGEGGRSWPPAEVARAEALGLWKRLEDCGEEDRRRLVETWSELQHPGLAELLCHLSEEAASDRAEQAMELARLAHRIAGLAPGGPAETERLLGYAGLYLGNTLRVGGELLPARARTDEALASWKAGEGSTTFLAEWRVLDIEASLLRDERQFKVALDRLDKALVLAPGEAGRLLLKKSAVHEQMGNGERALEELRKAEPLIHREREPRLFLILRFNTAAAYCLLDRFKEAEKIVPEIQALAAPRELDSVRLKWLTGRIAAGRGRLTEAAAALDEVRQDFHEKRSPWDCSLVTLELATVRLRQGRTAEVRNLSEELVWVFEAQGIHQEALAALALFRDAAQREQATADLTDRIVRYLRKAQGDPGLRFGA